MKKCVTRIGHIPKLEYQALESRQMLTTVVGRYDFQPQSFHIPQDTSQIVSTNLEAEPKIEQGPAHGELIYNADNGTLAYQPDAGFTGADSFQLDPSTNHISIRVWEPVFAVPDWTQVTPGQSTSVAVLINDYSFRSVDSQSYFSPWFEKFRWQQDSTGFTVVDFASDSGASVSISADGQSLNYTPAAGFHGTDTVSYTFEDVDGNRSGSTVTFDVTDQELQGRYFASADHMRQYQIENWMSQFAGSVSQYSHRPDMLWARVPGVIGFGMVTAFANADAVSSDQVVGVQEGDIVKANGDLLYYVTHNDGDGEFASFLSIVDVADPANPQLISTTGFYTTIHDIYLGEDRAAVILEENGLDCVIAFDNFGSHFDPTFQVVVLDVTNAENPGEVYRATIDGDFSDARLIGDQFYVISDSNENRISPWQLETEGSVVDPVSPGNFIDAILARDNGFASPTITVQANGITETITVGHDQYVRRDGFYSSTLITTFDIDSNSGIPTDIDLIESNNVNKIYVSTEAMYLFDGESIIKLDFLGQDEGVAFTADGQLKGHLISQFSADEYNGHLRVAVNDWDRSADVRVFKQVDDTLVLVSELDNIAPGESIYSTHFDGDQVFVVTFRRVDPLFVIDLSDPTSPTIAGELKIPGVSNYMQLIGDGLLLAVGRDADVLTGGFEALQVSLFDVSNSNDPQLLDRYTFKGGITTNTPLISSWWTGPTHQALTFDADTNTLSLPIYSSQSWWGDESTTIFEGQTSAVSLFEIDRENGIQVTGQVDFDSQALRTVIVGDNLVYLSAESLKTASRIAPTEVLGMLELPTGDSSQSVATPIAPVDPFPVDFENPVEEGISDTDTIADADPNAGPKESSLSQPDIPVQIELPVFEPDYSTFVQHTPVEFIATLEVHNVCWTEADVVTSNVATLAGSMALSENVNEVEQATSSGNFLTEHEIASFDSVFEQFQTSKESSWHSFFA